MQSIEHILSQDPDILCLQEVPHCLLEKLQDRGYHVSRTLDFEGISTGNKAYVCTMLKQKPVKTYEFDLHSPSKKSILNNVLYEKIWRNKELYKGLCTDIKADNKTLRIINTRLSTAIGLGDRLKQFASLLNETDKRFVNLIVGDINIGSSKTFNLMTGLFRGYTTEDFKTDEKEVFSKTIENFGYKNIFNNSNTMAVPFIKMQLDYILVPNEVSVKTKSIAKHGYGSDHRYLTAEIEL